jgi:hypothetical protein
MTWSQGGQPDRTEMRRCAGSVNDRRDDSVRDSFERTILQRA